MQDRPIIALASDHRGVALKATLAGVLNDRGFAVLDLGTDGDDSVDYPDFADAVADAIGDGRADRGVLVCGTGIGISIAANRHAHIRAALCRDAEDARMSRLHNDANVIVFGAEKPDTQTAVDCLELFLATPFEGGRHQSRVAKMSPNSNNAQLAGKV